MTQQQTQAWLDAQFAAAVERAAVPGASIAVLQNGQVATAAAGTLSLTTGVEATVDSIFQIGSITKLWTASLVMQLVDQGLVELDQPIQTYLPEFQLADAAAAASVTVRHLLSHRAGFEGDIFTDTGRGDDAIELYVASLSGLSQIFPPGAMFSYNNAGYVVLGRLVEKLRLQPYNEVLSQHLAQPLGLASVSPSPYEAILRRAAVGHVTGPDGQVVSAPVWALATSNAPAGSMLAMTAADLVGFAGLALNSGRAPDGATVLGAGALQAMLTRQVDLPRLTGLGQAWGLGYEIAADQPTLVVGHDGNTIGQAAFLRIVPEAGLAIALLTNGGDPYQLFSQTVSVLLRDLVGFQTEPWPTPAERPADGADCDVAPCLGRYSSSILDFVVRQDDEGRIWVDQEPKGLLLEMGERPERQEVTVFGPDQLIQLEPSGGLHPIFAFSGDDGAGRRRYVNFGRVIERAD
ncbi:MAG: beta-lactamase family protein [Propionibacteriaceae bacterium]|jgi:CubicO group peptidase (beta-lactamase class C family)|nr:beta-lactamase family protein [Propionibacteriaceae bacterium]